VIDPVPTRGCATAAKESRHKIAGIPRQFAKLSLLSDERKAILPQTYIAIGAATVKGAAAILITNRSLTVAAPIAHLNGAVAKAVP
jgi:hypothetical protein